MLQKKVNNNSNRKTKKEFRIEYAAIYLVFYTLLFIIFIFNVLSMNTAFAINEMIYFNIENNTFKIMKTNLSTYIPPSFGENKLVILNKLNQTVIKTNFDEEIVLIVPYELNNYNRIKVYKKYYVVFQHSLELCNHNGICENFEYLCDDCKKDNINYDKFIDNNQKKPNYNLIIFLVIIGSVLIIIAYVLNKITKQKNY